MFNITVLLFISLIAITSFGLSIKVFFNQQQSVYNTTTVTTTSPPPPPSPNSPTTTTGQDANQSQLQDFQKQINQMLSQIQTLQQQNNDLVNKIKQLNDTQQNQSKKITQVQNSIDQFQQQDFQKQINQTLSQIQTLQQQNNDLVNKTKQLNDTQQNQSKTITQVQNSIDQFQQQDFQKQINQTLSQIQTLQQQNNDLVNKTKQLNDTQQNQSKTITQVQNSIPTTILYDTVIQKKQWMCPYKSTYDRQEIDELFLDINVATKSIATLILNAHAQFNGNNDYICFAINGIPISQYTVYNGKNILYFAYHKDSSNSDYWPVSLVQKVKLQPGNYRISVIHLSDAINNNLVYFNGAGIQVELQTIPDKQWV
ncbi:hypothetical protein ABPG74_020827 [Tetrahymena malaccensis]